MKKYNFNFSNNYLSLLFYSRLLIFVAGLAGILLFYYSEGFMTFIAKSFVNTVSRNPIFAAIKYFQLERTM